MVTVIKGDLFKSEAQTLVNTVNCVGIMGAGIALEFKKRYHDMFIRYKRYCNEKLMKIGNLWLYKDVSGKWILCFPTKEDWRNPSKVDYLVSGLKKFVETYKEKEITSIAFPLLGANNGGIDPKLSLALMKRYLNECDIPIEIYVQVDIEK